MNLNANKLNITKRNFELYRFNVTKKKYNGILSNYFLNLLLKRNAFLRLIFLYENPDIFYIDIKNPIIVENFSGIKRQIGIAQKGKKPLTIENLKILFIRTIVLYLILKISL